MRPSEDGRDDGRDDACVRIVVKMVVLVSEGCRWVRDTRGEQMGEERWAQEVACRSMAEEAEAGERQCWQGGWGEQPQSGGGGSGGREQHPNRAHSAPAHHCQTPSHSVASRQAEHNPRDQ